MKGWSVLQISPFPWFLWLWSLASCCQAGELGIQNFTISHHPSSHPSTHLLISLHLSYGLTTECSSSSSYIWTLGLSWFGCKTCRKWSLPRGSGTPGGMGINHYSRAHFLLPAGCFPICWDLRSSGLLLSFLVVVDWTLSEGSKINPSFFKAPLLGI